MDKQKPDTPPIVYPGVNGKRNCCYTTDDTQEEDDLVGSFHAGHGVGVHGVADGQVPLEGESEDGEHRAVGSPELLYINGGILFK